MTAPQSVARYTADFTRTIRSTHPPARGRRILLYRKQATRQDAA